MAPALCTIAWRMFKNLDEQALQDLKRTISNVIIVIINGDKIILITMVVVVIVIIIIIIVWFLIARDTRDTRRDTTNHECSKL